MKEKKMLEKCIGKIEIGRQVFFWKKFFGLFFYFYIYIEKIMTYVSIYGKDGESDIVHISLRKKNLFFGIIISKQLQKSSPIN